MQDYVNGPLYRIVTFRKSRKNTSITTVKQLESFTVRFLIR